MTKKQIENRKKLFAAAFRKFITWKSGGNKIKIYLGADIGEVRQWIEDNWLEGMNWENYGKLWVIDHIVPHRMFNPFEEEDLKLCWHYKNLMPLFKDDNLKKEGNVFFSFELLFELKDKDHFYRQLFDRVKPEVEWMAKYITQYHRRYNPGTASVHPIKKEKSKTA